MEFLLAIIIALWIGMQIGQGKKISFSIEDLLWLSFIVFLFFFPWKSLLFAILVALGFTVYKFAKFLFTNHVKVLKWARENALGILGFIALIIFLYMMDQIKMSINR